MYKLFYNPQMPSALACPEMTLDLAIHMGNERREHVLPKLVRANWITQDLQCNGIIHKPLFLREDFFVMTGDTRMLAVDVLGIKTVPALIQVPDTASVGNKWTEVQDKKHLAKIMQTSEKYIVGEDWHDQPLEWIEFALPHTQHHMHDPTQRERMMANYLNAYPDTVFSREWFLQSIDWSSWDF